VNVELISSVNIGDYSTVLSYTQPGVPAYTDQSLTVSATILFVLAILETYPFLSFSCSFFFPSLLDLLSKRLSMKQLSVSIPL
jgi:hypothetical protein